VAKKIIDVIPFQIICGRNFTIILSKSGIYSVGENNHKQLGSSDTTITSEGTNRLSRVKDCQVYPVGSHPNPLTDQLIEPFIQLVL
jgi:alpha-tubulin suppressor-like RCC1 family protein